MWDKDYLLFPSVTVLISEIRLLENMMLTKDLLKFTCSSMESIAWTLHLSILERKFRSPMNGLTANACVFVSYGINS